VSWARGVNYEGREIGYAVEGVCEEHGCEAPIDLGLAYCCGGLDGVDGERGCGHYFCGAHLFYVAGAPEDSSGRLCGRCADKARCAECWEDEPDMLHEKDGEVLCEVCIGEATGT